MRICKYSYPRNKWVQSLETDKWYSQPRTQEDIDTIKSTLSILTGASIRDISWNSSNNVATVMRP